jgi:hypothetical protein
MGTIISLFGKRKPTDGIDEDVKALREMSERVKGAEDHHDRADAADAYASLHELRQPESGFRMLDVTLERFRKAYVNASIPPTRLPPDAPELYAALFDIRHHNGLEFGVEEQQELFVQFGSLQKAVEDISYTCKEILSILEHSYITTGPVVAHINKLVRTVAGLDINNLAHVDANREALYLVYLKVARMDLLLSGPEDMPDTTTPWDEFGTQIDGLLPYIQLARVSLSYLPEFSKKLVAIGNYAKDHLEECRLASSGRLTDDERERLEVSFCAALMECDLAIREALFQEANDILVPPDDATAYPVSSEAILSPFTNATMLCTSGTQMCLPIRDAEHHHTLSSENISVAVMPFNTCFSASATYALAGSMGAMVPIV